MRRQSGLSLIELMSSLAIGGIASLAMASLFVFATEQLMAMMDQNEAEENLLLASYYLRVYISQAVKTGLTYGDASVKFGTGTPPPPPDQPPFGVAVGYIDASKVCVNAGGVNCQSMSTTLPGIDWVPGVINSFALFIRENGGETSPPVSMFVPTGIFYTPSNGATSGVLYIAQLGTPTGTFTLTDVGLRNHLRFDKIVAFGLTDPLTGQTYKSYNAINIGVPHTPISNLSLFLKTRYFQSGSTVRDYSQDPAVAAAAGARFRDMDMTVAIVLRDNILKKSSLDPNIYERVNTGLYFYRYISPINNQF